MTTKKSLSDSLLFSALICLVVTGCTTVSNREESAPVLTSGPIKDQIAMAQPAPMALGTFTSVPEFNTVDRYPIWYATNRAYGLKKNDPTKIPSCTSDFKQGHGKDVRGEATVYGQCWVNVPATHTSGETNGVKIDPANFKGFAKFADFWIDVNKNRTAATDHSVLVFIHGFNVSFQDAIIRGAQLGHDLAMPTTVVYSWPTSDRERLTLNLVHDIAAIPAGYPADEANIEASENAIGDFLIQMIQKAHDENFSLHVIAHSMGNRGVLRGLDRAYWKAGGKIQGKIDQIVLAAPDVDNEVFTNLSEVYSKIAKRTTIYTSKKDWAVEMSKALHDAPRVGYAIPTVVIKPFDTVDTSDAPSHWLLSGWEDHLIGHGYFADKSSVLYDLKQVFRGVSPNERGLTSCGQNQRYYTFSKSNCN